MLDNIRVEDILFLDIETVPGSILHLRNLNPSLQTLWEKKSKQFRTPDQNPDEVYERAGIYSEFGRIVCISVGLIKEKNPFSFRLKSFLVMMRKSLLSEFSEMLKSFARQTRKLFCVLITERNLIILI